MDAHLVIALAAALSACSAAPNAREDHFETKIRPLLARHCVGCHGPKKQQGGLRLDDRAGWMRGGDSGTALAPGKPDESLLVKAVRRSGPNAPMPPKGALTAQEIRDIEHWVRDGAFDPREASKRLGGMDFAEARSWWSFQPLKPYPPPGTGHPVDAFLAAKMAPLGLAFKPLSPKRDLLRRLCYDLTGLPPTPAMMDAFLADDSPDAYEALVDRLLASPAYGERWGRHWLDLARYADSAGENSDHPVVNAWRYRDWVIQAFNRDMPYDQFIRAQVAGDLIAPMAPESEKADMIIATGFLAIARRFGHDTDADMHLTHEDAIDTLGKTFLGISLGCARCHDHKYDPITTRDYYALYGILQSTRFPFPGCEAKMQPRDMVPLPFSKAQQDMAKKIDAAIDAIDAEKRRLAPPEMDFSNSRVLTNGTVPEGKSAALSPPATLALDKGDMLLLSITPLANQGADFTRVDWKLGREGDLATSRDLSVETVDSLGAGNPSPANPPGTPDWYFFDLHNKARLLWKPEPDAYGNKALFAWRAESETPAVMANSSKEPVKVFTSLPGRAFFAHPGPSSPVGIGFLAPAKGSYRISINLSDAHPGGPDGVGFTLSLVPASTLGNLARHVESRTRIHQLELERASLLARKPAPELAYAVVEAKPGDAAIQIRGEPEKKGPMVPRGMPGILGGSPVSVSGSSGRMELANWLAAPANSLVARVMVNRVWQHHFGDGLVRSPSDFGSRGIRPTHPELLDWLARYFIQNKYGIKRMHKLLVTSMAYRQSAGEPSTMDPDNLLLSRFSRRRLDAEEIRDSLLMAAGTLDHAPGGAHPFPPEKTWGFTQHNPFAATYDTNKRAVYQMTTRNRRHPFFALFDGADPNATTPQRQQTTVPTQALFFMNDPLVHDSAKALAARVAGEKSSAEQITAIYRLALQRLPGDREMEAILALFPPGISRLPQTDLASVARVVFSGNSFLTVD